MQNPSSDFRGLLPRSIPGRVLIGTLSAGISVFTSAICWGALCAYAKWPQAPPQPGGQVEPLLMLFLAQLTAALTLFFVLEVVWAIAAPAWIERILARVIWRIVLAYMLLFPAIFWFAPR